MNIASDCFKKRVLSVVGFVCFLLTSHSGLTATWKITYADWERESPVFNQYPPQLLALALEQTGVKYSISPSQKALSQSQSIKQLSARGEVNLVWASTDNQRETDLLPIRIPIFKGLIGWRMFVTRKENAVLLNNVKTLNDLQRFTMVQGTRWVDTRILQSNGFEVATSEQYDELFWMTKNLDMAVFPRSVVELEEELLGGNVSGLVANRKVGISYPLAFYFFVHKKDRLLAKVIEDGLEKAIEKGLFQALFNQYHKQYLQQFERIENTFIQLENPLLPVKTPLNRKELWHQSTQSSKRKETL